jgi:dienelactone hydrolase
VSPGTGLAKDVRFISDLIDDLEKAFNVDPTRIYADGLSNGGGMAFVLSCTLSDRIAAVGMVAAAQSLPWDWCTDRRPVPMIAFHGTADRLVPYEGGTSWVGPVSFPDVSRWTASWARRNRCGPDPVETTVAADVTRRDYTDCADDAAVVLFTIHGGGHTWPGGEPLPEWFLGTTSRGVDATRESWAFFQEHRLARRRPRSRRQSKTAPTISAMTSKAFPASSAVTLTTAPRTSGACDATATATAARAPWRAGARRAPLHPSCGTRARAVARGRTPCAPTPVLRDASAGHAPAPEAHST